MIYQILAILVLKIMLCMMTMQILYTIIIMWLGLQKQGKIYHEIWWDISQYWNVVFEFCKMCWKAS